MKHPGDLPNTPRDDDNRMTQHMAYVRNQRMMSALRRASKQIREQNRPQRKEATPHGTPANWLNRGVKF